MQELNYTLITVASNEAGYIGGVLDSVARQTVRPKRWIIVDDSSMDDTAAIIRRHLDAMPYVQLIQLNHGGPRSFLRKVKAVNTGIEAIQSMPSDFIGILDADITLEADYYERLMGRFHQQPKLGAAAGIILEKRHGEFAPRFATAERNVAGAIQLFRRECFDQIGRFIPMRFGGEDTVALEMIRMRDWEVQSFPDLRACHHRVTGTAGIGAYRSFFRNGMRDSTLGYHPVYMLAKSLYRFAQPPYCMAGVLNFCGFCWASAIGGHSPAPPEVLRSLRQRQVRRLQEMIFRNPVEKADAAEESEIDL